MTIKHGTKKKIAKWLGLKESFFSAIINGHRRPSAARAEELEDISGIEMKYWQRMETDQLFDLIVAAYKKENEKDEDHPDVSDVIDLLIDE